MYWEHLKWRWKLTEFRAVGMYQNSSWSQSDGLETDYNKYYNMMVAFRLNYSQSTSPFRWACALYRDVNTVRASNGSARHLRWSKRFWLRWHWNPWRQTYKWHNNMWQNSNYKHGKSEGGHEKKSAENAKNIVIVAKVPQ